MKYQDTRINGVTTESGIRSCENRYEIVRKYCAESFVGPFSVLDVGANMCYFGLRLIEDFGCQVMAFEFHQWERRNKIVMQNKTGNLIFLKRKLSLADIKTMGHFCEFDVVLAMSVMHHLPGDSAEWMRGFRELGSTVIVEFAGGDSKRTAGKKNYSLPNDAIILGHTGSHLDKQTKRPIAVIKGKQ